MPKLPWQDPSLDYSGDVDECALGRDRLLMEAQVEETEAQKTMRRLWVELRILAEGSDWKRDSGESLEEWTLRHVKNSLEKGQK